MTKPYKSYTDYNILALDPGGTTGWALFSYKGILVNSGEIPQHFVGEWLEAIEPGVIVAEKYMNMPYKKQGGSDMPASQVIGVIKEYCNQHHAKLVLQSNTIKPIGYKWAGKKEDTHENDAIAHGWYYCQRTGLIKSRLIDG